MTEQEMALIAEAAKKAGLLWVTPPGGRPQAAWHVWQDDAFLLVGEGLEQPLPGLADGMTVEISLASKDNRARLVTFTAAVTELRPTGGSRADWLPAAAALHASRLNPPDGEQQPLRWERESRIFRLVPGDVIEVPGRMSESSGAAPPPPTPATTRGELPFVLGRATGRAPAATGRIRRRKGRPDTPPG